jgi:hypothetical protein
MATATHRTIKNQEINVKTQISAMAGYSIARKNRDVSVEAVFTVKDLCGEDKKKAHIGLT